MAVIIQGRLSVLLKEVSFAHLRVTTVSLYVVEMAILIMATC